MKEARAQASLRAIRRGGKQLSQEAMAEAVARELGRSLHQAQWSDYENGVTDPPYDVVIATAKVSELPPEYIAFGVLPILNIGPEDVRGLTPEELDRAEIQAAEDDRRQAAAQPKRAVGGAKPRGGSKGRP